MVQYACWTKLANMSDLTGAPDSWEFIGPEVLLAPGRMRIVMRHGFPLPLGHPGSVIGFPQSDLSALRDLVEELPMWDRGHSFVGGAGVGSCLHVDQAWGLPWNDARRSRAQILPGSHGLC